VIVYFYPAARILDGHRRLADAQAQSRRGPAEEFPEHLVQVVADRAEIGRLLASLINTARKDWITLENSETKMPLTMDFVQTAARSWRAGALPVDLRRRRIRRSGRPAACRGLREGRGGGTSAAGCANEDEARRPERRAAVAHPYRHGGALLVRAPLITAALRGYFEMLWEKATPVSAGRAATALGRLPAAQQTVLAPMAEGLHDDAIARRAHLSTTTVRRHIAAIMKRRDVTTRFAAGAAAQRRGSIG